MLSLARDYLEYTRTCEAEPDLKFLRCIVADFSVSAEISRVDAEHATEIYRRLAKERPAVYRADLAEVLVELGDNMPPSIDREDGAKALGEAVGLYCMLTSEDPATYQGRLLHGLEKLRVAFVELGKAKTILRSYEEIIRKLMDHFFKNPEEFGALMETLIRDFQVAAEEAGVEQAS